jgi:hypothetical protein
MACRFEFLDGLGHLAPFGGDPRALGRTDGGGAVFEAFGDGDHRPLVASQLGAQQFGARNEFVYPT